MTAAVTNPFKLTWGSFVVGGTTEKLIDSLHSLTKTHDTFEITLDVVIRGTSDATFATNCAEMESEFSKRRQLILFEIGSSTIQSFNPASGTYTGLNSYARIDKVGTPMADTDRSRKYTITVGCELPSTDTSGRRDIRIIVERSPAKQRTVTFQGVWTALTSNGATAQYAAQIDSYCSSALTALSPSGTFEAINGLGRTDRDDQDHTIQFTRVYREIIVAQPSGSLDNATIVEPTFQMARSYEQPGDSGGGAVRRLQTVTASFSCYIDYTVSTDLDSLYTGTIRPYMISQFETQYSPNQYGIVSEQPSYIPYTNQLVCTMVFSASINATDVVESVETARIVEDSGVVLTGAWDGNIFAKYVDQGIATRTRFSIRRIRVLGTLNPRTRLKGNTGGGFAEFFNQENGSGAFGGYGQIGSFASFFNQENGSGAFGGYGAQGSSGGWTLMQSDSSVTPRWIGQPDGSQIAVTDLVETVIEQWTEEPRGGGGGGGGGSGGGGAGDMGGGHGAYGPNGNYTPPVVTGAGSGMNL